MVTEDDLLEDEYGGDICIRETYPKVKTLECPECGDLLAFKVSVRGGFYGCVNYPDCPGTHGALPDGTPLGTPVTQETKHARREAQKAFNRLEEIAGIVESASWLQENMDGASNIAEFDLYQCQELFELINEEIYERVENEN